MMTKGWTDRDAVQEEGSWCGPKDQVLDEMHTGATLVNASEQFVRGGDATLYQFTLTSCFQFLFPLILLL